MKIIILSIFLFFSIINITNAFPAAVLLLWYDFLLLLIPIILWFFSTIYFYFRKYIFYINLFLYLISIFLYFYYYFFLKTEIFFKYEFFLFFIPILFFFIIFNYKVKFLNYILLLFLLSSSITIGKLNYYIYDFYNIKKCILKNIPIWMETKFLYKKSYMVVFWSLDNKKTYIVIDKLNRDNFNKDKWIYYYWNWDKDLWSYLANIWFNCVK